jgi:hypothetical protein
VHFLGFRGLFWFCRDSGEGDVSHCVNHRLQLAGRRHIPLRCYRMP